MHFFEGLTKIIFGQFELVLEDDDNDDDNDNDNDDDDNNNDDDDNDDNDDNVDDKRHERRVKIFSQMIKKLTEF